LVIESFEETKHEDSLMRTDLHQKEQVIVSLEDEIKKREQFLQLAVEQQKELS
jgi:sulfur carrier protein ThiS